ncbi:putative Exo-beta-1,3-glucanase [Elsinoe ampelina]|uniref:Putative Exo-beta-1,3-glucanase n=1 Tax=Elsinoe ampelina TaxID=302913 RepID=A0A6A6G2W3_9PEZI|nr:putative Exo-beta-1,3-glucanase [Elsinoe ampelina]
MHVSLLTTIATCVAAVAAQSNQVSFIDGNTKIRGVNLGGWLVLEPWIRPSIFNPFKGTGIVDEFTLTQKRPAQAKTILQKHWDEWVTLKDMRQIKAAGFNMVRLPIGFWAYDNKNTPYIKGQAKYVDKLIGWARQVDLKVLIDLHGAPGSQNGFDNSGRRRENPGWQQADPEAKRTRAVLKKIQRKYGAASYDDVILGIELLNEPLYTKIDDAYLRQFYYDGFYQQRDYLANRVVVMSDAFRVTSYWNGMLTPSDNGAQNAAMDHHEYQVFDPNLIGMTPAQHRQQVCKAVDQYNSVDKWTIIGEWSGAMTDCATWLNGFERGARYDNTYTPPGQTGKYVGSCQGKSDISTWSQAMRKQTRKYIEVQMQEFEKYTRGWVFWNFKTEGAGEWDALRLVKEGIFPTPGGTYQYPNQCK